METNGKNVNSFLELIDILDNQSKPAFKRDIGILDLVADDKQDVS